MILDGHTHVYPDRVAKQAIAASPADLKRFGDGTVGSLSEVMAASGVDRTCPAPGCEAGSPASTGPPSGVEETWPDRFCSSLMAPSSRDRRECEL